MVPVIDVGIMYCGMLEAWFLPFIHLMMELPFSLFLFWIGSASSSSSFLVILLLLSSSFLLHRALTRE